MVLRRHPHSSLLPYTTLFRSYLLDAVRLLRRSVYWRPQDEHAFEQWCESYLNWLLNGEQGRKLSRASSFHAIAYDLQVRSEEHTSELQSRGHLVCRLHLEKKH